MPEPVRRACRLTEPVLPTDEQQQRAKWDLLLLDIEYRTEQLRQAQSYEPRRLLIAIAAASTVFAAGGVVGGLLVRLLSGH
jgi:hypothetical protein